MYFRGKLTHFFWRPRPRWFSTTVETKTSWTKKNMASKQLLHLQLYPNILWLGVQENHMRSLFSETVVRWLIKSYQFNVHCSFCLWYCCLIRSTYMEILEMMCWCEEMKRDVCLSSVCALLSESVLFISHYIILCVSVLQNTTSFRRVSESLTRLAK